MSLTVPVREIVAESNDSLLAIHPSWERVPLGAIAEILNGFAFKSAFFNRSKGMPLLRIRDVGKDQTECFYEGAYELRYIVRADDLIVGMDGDFKCARWTGADALLNQRVCKIELITRNYEPSFLNLALPGYLRAINERTSSQTVRHLSSQSIAEIPLPLPPLAEQKRIVAKVEELLTRVSAAKERLSKVSLILKRFYQAVLAAACSGRLTAAWRDQNPSKESGEYLLEIILKERELSFKKNRIKKNKINSLEDKEPFDLPKTWVWATIGQITENFDGERIPVKAEDRQKRRGLYNYYGASGIIDSIDDYLFDGEFLLIAEDGANLLSRSTPIAFRARGKFWVNNHAHIVQTYGGIPLQFLEGYLNGIDLQQYVTGSAQPKLTQEAMNRIPVPLPPIDEQQEIVRRVEAMFKLAEAVEKRVAMATVRAEKLTQAILAKAFRGELVPTEAELARRERRSYESASELLARIKAEQKSNFLLRPNQKGQRYQKRKDKQVRAQNNSFR